MHIQNLSSLLRNIGLSEKEAYTYLITLQIGANPASIIAKHSNMNRTTIYSILESLMGKGLVSEYVKNKIRYFVAEDPKELINYIEAKNIDLIHYKDEIVHLIPYFESLRQKPRTKPQFKSYLGKTGIKQIFQKLLTESQVYMWTEQSKIPNEFFNYFASQSMRNHQKLKIITFTESSVKKYFIKSVKDFQKLPPQLPVKLIGEQSIFIISPKQEYGIEIQNKQITKLFQKEFDTIWIKKKDLPS